MMVIFARSTIDAADFPTNQILTFGVRRMITLYAQHYASSKGKSPLFAIPLPTPDASRSRHYAFLPHLTPSRLTNSAIDDGHAVGCVLHAVSIFSPNRGFRHFCARGMLTLPLLDFAEFALQFCHSKTIRRRPAISEHAFLQRDELISI